MNLFGDGKNVTAMVRIHGQEATFNGQPLSPAMLIWMIYSETGILLLEKFRAGVPFYDWNGGRSSFNSKGRVVPIFKGAFLPGEMLNVALFPTEQQKLDAYAAAFGFGVDKSKKPNKTAGSQARRHKAASLTMDPGLRDFLIAQALNAGLMFLDTGKGKEALAKLKPHLPTIKRIHEVSGVVIGALEKAGKQTKRRQS